MLVVVKDRDVEMFFEFVFDFEVCWCGDVFEIDVVEGWSDVFDCFDDFFWIFCCEVDGECIDVGEFFEE